MSVNLENQIWMDGVFITLKLSNPALQASIYTVCDMLDDLKRVEALERVLDRSPIVEVKKIDERDPPRNPSSGFSEVLTRLVKERRRDYGVLVQSTSGGRIPFTTMMELRRMGRLGPVGKRDSGYSWISLTLNRKLLKDYDINEFRKLFLEVCTAVEAFYGGSAEDNIMCVQREIFMAKAAKNPLERKKNPDFDQEIWDVYWLNYFGAGYVQFWGQDKIDRLAEQYDVTRFVNGAVCVQTTPKPVFADPNAKGITDYPWKRHMYDVLGWNTFMHETQKQGKPGQYVPTLDDHRRILKQK